MDDKVAILPDSWIMNISSNLDMRKIMNNWICESITHSICRRRVNTTMHDWIKFTLAKEEIRHQMTDCFVTHHHRCQTLHDQREPGITSKIQTLVLFQCMETCKSYRSSSTRYRVYKGTIANVRGLMPILKLSYKSILSIYQQANDAITYLGFEKDLLLGGIGITCIYNADNVWKLLLNVANSCPQDAFTTTSCVTVKNKGE